MLEDKEKVKEELWCEALKNGHTMKYRALGHSMSPFIKNGSVLTIKPDNKICIGDVILCRLEDSLFAHRVIAKRHLNGKFIYITKGDNLRDTDPETNLQNVLGKSIAVEYNGKMICMSSFKRRIANYMIAIMSGSLLSFVFLILHKAISFKRILGRVANGC